MTIAAEEKTHRLIKQWGNTRTQKAHSVARVLNFYETRLAVGQKAGHKLTD